MDTDYYALIGMAKGGTATFGPFRSLDAAKKWAAIEISDGDGYYTVAIFATRQSLRTFAWDWISMVENGSVEEPLDDPYWQLELTSMDHNDRPYIR